MYLVVKRRFTSRQNYKPPSEIRANAYTVGQRDAFDAAKSQITGEKSRTRDTYDTTMQMHLYVFSTEIISVRKWKEIACHKSFNLAPRN